MAKTLALPGHEVIGIIPADALAKHGIVTAAPIVDVPWFDDRQTCKLVHDYLEGKIEGRFDEYSACKNYAIGVCAGTGGAGLLCMFHESDRSLAWRRAQRWQRVYMPDGTVALQRCPK